MPYLPILLTRTQGDTDAIAILNAITAAGVTPTTAMVNAAHYFVSASKWAGLWTKFTAVYGLMGGTAAAHAINWKTPGTYDITWGGTVTHNSNGITGNGSTGYGNTGLKPRTAIADPMNCHVGWYARTITASMTSELGCYNTNSDVLLGYSNYTGNGASLQVAYGAGGSHPVLANPVAGFFAGSRTSATMSKMYGRTRSNFNTTSASGKTLPNLDFYILACNGLAGFSSNNFGFLSIGSGLTDQNAKDLSFIVQSTQNILSRAV